MKYVVTLTHKEKVEVTATTPEDALTHAHAEVSGKDFKPTTSTIKEVKE